MTIGKAFFNIQARALKEI